MTTSTRISVPELWRPMRMFGRGTGLFVVVTLGLVIVTLPLLLWDTVMWIASIGLAATASLIIVARVLDRQQLADIQKNGPFYIFEPTEITLPDSKKISLIDAEIAIWRVTTHRSQNTTWPARAYVRVRSGDTTLLFEGATTGYIEVLDCIRHDDSLELMGKTRPIRVHTPAMLQAIVLLQKPQVSPVVLKNNPVNTPSTKPTETPMEPIQTPPTAPTNEPTPPPTKTREELMLEALAKGKKKVVNANNVISLVKWGDIKEVPKEFLGLVRDYRDNFGGTLLHDDSRGIPALLAAGLDPLAVDSRGRTPLMVFGRTPLANLKLLDAGVPAEACCNEGHTAVYYQAAPSGSVGFVIPDLAGVQVLFDAGLPVPTREQAEEWKEWARHSVTAAAENSACFEYCAWLDKITGVTP